MDRVRVFVYGTLLTGYANHALVEDLTESADAGTVAGYRLLDLGAFPGARPASGLGVRGEVLTLRNPAEALKRLDHLEGVPSLYTRERVTVALDDGTEVRAWMYVLAAGRGGGLTPLTATEGGTDSWRAHKPARKRFVPSRTTRSSWSPSRETYSNGKAWYHQGEW